MIDGFEEWASSEGLILSSPLETLRDRCLAIDAETYIQKLVTEDPTKEPLLPALGGVPLQIEKHLEEAITKFKNAGIKPFFVFSGLSPSGEQSRSNAARQLAKKIDEAWDQYNASDPDKAVITFGTACSFDIDHIYRHVQSIFHRMRVPYLVAPYSAHAQLAYMEGDFADAIYGSSELLLYTSSRPVLDVNFEASSFRFVDRQKCIDALAQGNTSMWVDICLLSGSSLLPSLPQLESKAATPARPPHIRAAAELLKRTQVTGYDIAQQANDEGAMPGFDYHDNFQKAVMTVRHHVITTIEGNMLLLNRDKAPSNVHEFMGQQLPEEIYYYVSRGVIGPRVFTWRATGLINEKPPVDSGASITYQSLVRDKIVPQRTKALRLLSQALHRFYQHADVNLRVFFGQPGFKKLGVTEAGDLKASIASWHVQKSAIMERSKMLKVNGPNLYFAIESLASPEFAKSTITPKPKDGYKALQDVQEMQSNALWRYLQLHDYVTKTHELSPLGNGLRAAYRVASSRNLNPEDFGEPLLLGIELLRLKLLSFENLFPVPPYYGAPFRGSETDMRHNSLVSRVACLGRLKHKAIGYTGPLSRHILAYKSLISVLRQSQRDMLDMSLCTMFLDGDLDRQIPEAELRDVGFGLPFIRDNDCALGIASKHYLDELSATSNPTAPESRKRIKERGKGEWFPHAVDFAKSLDYAFTLFDAMTAAVRELPAEIVSKEMKKDWEGVVDWLKDRR